MPHPHGKAMQQMFKVAFAKIDDALSKECYIEVVAISESIISDRLRSFIVAHSNEPMPNFVSLARYIKTAKSILKTLDKPYHIEPELFGDLGNWRVKRNKVIHSIISAHTDASVEKFRVLSKECAEEGQLLAKRVRTWRNKMTTIKGMLTKREKAGQG